VNYLEGLSRGSVYIYHIGLDFSIEVVDEVIILNSIGLVGQYSFREVFNCNFGELGVLTEA
jgi:hypothetical protein